MVENSTTLKRLAGEGQIAIVGALYDVACGEMEFLPESASEHMTVELLRS
jgi:hypothetical protein